MLRYKAAGGVVVHNGRVLVLRRPSRNEVRLPKGHIEPGESPRVAALRETREESGYSGLKILTPLGEQTVQFQHEGQNVVRCEYFFLMTLTEKTPEMSGEGQFEPLWLTWEEALQSLTFEAEREWLRRAWQAYCELQPETPIARPRLALSTGSLYTYGTARTFELAARAGFEWVEVLIDQHWDTRHPGYLRRLAEATGLQIAALHSPFAAEVPGWEVGALDRLKRTVVLAQDLGVHTVVVHLPLRFNTLLIQWQSADRLHRARWIIPRMQHDPYVRFLREEITDYEGQTGVTIAVENMPARRLLHLRFSAYSDHTPAAWRRFPHLALDTTHLATWGMDPLLVYNQLREQIVHVHLSNFDGREHRSPPDGQLALAELLQALAQDGFAGTITVESEPAALGAEDEECCLAALRRANTFCRQHLEPTG